MATQSIENPVINSPFVEPQQHFVTTADGQVTGDIEPRRRPSEFFVSVAPPKKRSGQLTMDAFGGPQRQQPNEIVNEIRQSVARWRAQEYPPTVMPSSSVTATSPAPTTPTTSSAAPSAPTSVTKPGPP